MRAQLGEVHLINARDDVPIVQDIRARGIELDKGMVLKLGDDFYHGDKCMYMLALLSSESNIINRAPHSVPGLVPIKCREPS
jgi:hypothetical protein